jgi:hypothetical protein
MALPVIGERGGYREVARHSGAFAQVRKVPGAKVHAVQREQIGSGIGIATPEMMLQVVDRLGEALQ